MWLSISVFLWFVVDYVCMISYLYILAIVEVPYCHIPFWAQKNPCPILRTKTKSLRYHLSWRKKSSPHDIQIYVCKFYGLRARRLLLAKNRVPAALRSPFTKCCTATIPPYVALWKSVHCATLLPQRFHLIALSILPLYPFVKVLCKKVLFSTDTMEIKKIVTGDLTRIVVMWYGVDKNSSQTEGIPCHCIIS